MRVEFIGTLRIRELFERINGIMGTMLSQKKLCLAGDSAYPHREAALHVK